MCDSFRLSEKTLDILNALCPCKYPSEFDAVRMVAYSLSITARLILSIDAPFEAVIRNFMETAVPGFCESFVTHFIS